MSSSVIYVMNQPRGHHPTEVKITSNGTNGHHGWCDTLRRTQYCLRIVLAINVSLGSNNQETWEKKKRKPALTERHFITQLACPFQNANSMKVKERQRDCSRLEDNGVTTLKNSV